MLARFHNEFGVDAREFDRAKHIADCRYPLLLAAGEMENREELFSQLKAANPMHTDIVILPGCNHGNGMYKQTEMFQGAIKAFLCGNMGSI